MRFVFRTCISLGVWIAILVAYFDQLRLYAGLLHRPQPISNAATLPQYNLLLHCVQHRVSYTTLNLVELCANPRRSWAGRRYRSGLELCCLLPVSFDAGNIARRILAWDMPYLGNILRFQNLSVFEESSVGFVMHLHSGVLEAPDNRT